MLIRHVVNPHPLCRNPAVDPCPAGLTPGVWKRLAGWGCSTTSRAVVAEESGKVVGFFRFRRVTHSQEAMKACGTWVHPQLRGKEVARRLWEQALERFQPDIVWVGTVSRGGFKLGMSLARRFPRITFKVQPLLYWPGQR